LPDALPKVFGNVDVLSIPGADHIFGGLPYALAALE
jgi:hypothetical protein